MAHAETRGHAPDSRGIDDISTVDRCGSCGLEPAAIILTDGSWRCYNCDKDPNHG